MTSLQACGPDSTSNAILYPAACTCTICTLNDYIKMVCNYVLISYVVIYLARLCVRPYVHVSLTPCVCACMHMCMRVHTCVYKCE